MLSENWCVFLVTTLQESEQRSLAPARIDAARGAIVPKANESFFVRPQS
jgi:hypothetical protein